jgi:hypothetical protein
MARNKAQSSGAASHDGSTTLSTHEQEDAAIEISLKVPLTRFVAGCFIKRRVDCAQLTAAQAVTLKSITLRLMQDGATLASGRYVRSESDAVKWWLEQCHSSAPTPLTESPPAIAAPQAEAPADVEAPTALLAGAD